MTFINLTSIFDEISAKVENRLAIVNAVLVFESCMILLFDQLDLMINEKN